MHALYSLLTAAGVLLLSPYFLLRGLIQGKYLSNIPERLGWRFPPGLRGAISSSSTEKAIWIHAVSVGEVLAVLPLAQQLKKKFPLRRLVVSTTTVTGQKIARERMLFADAVFYFPLDWRGPVRRALDAARAGAVIVVEPPRPCAGHFRERASVGAFIPWLWPRAIIFCRNSCGVPEESIERCSALSHAK
jgi:3-deoxy-D-manno-octulosonic-acid transferase